MTTFATNIAESQIQLWYRDAARAAEIFLNDVRQTNEIE